MSHPLPAIVRLWHNTSKCRFWGFHAGVAGNSIPLYYNAAFLPEEQKPLNWFNVRLLSRPFLPSFRKSTALMQSFQVFPSDTSIRMENWLNGVGREKHRNPCLSATTSTKIQHRLRVNRPAATNCSATARPGSYQQHPTPLLKIYYIIINKGRSMQYFSIVL